MPAVNTGLGGPVGLGENSFLATALDAGNYDDGSIEVDVTSVFGGGIEFFGTTYSSIFINSNGLITFEGPNTTYDGTDLATLDEPALAPFWTDHDLRGGDPAGSNNIYWDIDPVNDQITITWFEVEAYLGPGTNTFQVVLTDLGNGTVGIEYIYEDIGFTQGFNAQAQTGVTDGAGNDFIIPGSGDGTALANFGTADLDDDSPNGTWDLFINNGVVVCFLEGTLIETADGPKPVQWLRAGDMIATKDNGYQPLQVALNSRFVACERTLPICIAAHTFDNTQDLYVSPNHRVLIAHEACELLFGEAEVFAYAKHLVDFPGVSSATAPAKVSYFHLLFAKHEIIFANGHPSESFFVGDVATLTLEQSRNSMRDAAARHTSVTQTSRLTLKAFEAQLLVAYLTGRQGQTALPDMPISHRAY